MAHRSKRKHLAHVHEHEPATPPAKSPVEKAEAARRGVAKKAPTRRAAADPKTAKPKRGGLVRRLAKRATKKITRKITSKLSWLVK